MLVVVNQPHINDFKIEGTISPSFLEDLKKEFGKDLSIKETDDKYWMNANDWKPYQEWKENATPGAYVRNYRTRDNLTQSQLGDKLGVSKQYISDMENGRRSIGKEMAKRLSSLFGCPIERFI